MRTMWNEKEDEYLLTHYKDMSYPAIARVLGRPPNSARMRARRLKLNGLKSNIKSNEQREYLRKISLEQKEDRLSSFHKHESEVLAQTDILRSQGFRAFPITNSCKKPDIIAVRDNKVFGVEVTFKNRPRYFKWDKDNGGFDDIIWIVKGVVSSRPTRRILRVPCIDCGGLDGVFDTHQLCHNCYQKRYRRRRRG
jgi:hypothetical protein